MAREAWLSGKLEGFSPILMPAAHALWQARAELERLPDFTADELLARPGGAPSAAFHLRHIAGSIDRLLTYSRGAELSAAQFDFLKLETAEIAQASAAELIGDAIKEITAALEELQQVSAESLFETRYVGREKLESNVFGLLFHIAEHTARHVGQLVTTAKIVRKYQKDR